jgi:hypothetical protein
MGNDLDFLAQLVTERSQQLQRSLEGKSGRGSTLIAALDPVLSKFENLASVAATTVSTSSRAEGVLIRNLLRAKQQLDLAYEVVAHFRDDIGRVDLPVGLLYLIDDLIRDLLPADADPLLHLNDQYMYSTLPLLETLPRLLSPRLIPEPHPVAFYIPKLNPANALFAPILAHEVGHTSWRQGIQTDLQVRIDQAAVKSTLDQAVASGADPTEWRRHTAHGARN